MYMRRENPGEFYYFGNRCESNTSPVAQPVVLVDRRREQLMGRTVCREIYIGGRVVEDEEEGVKSCLQLWK
jgi:hypothetical protein